MRCPVSHLTKGWCTMRTLKLFAIAGLLVGTYLLSGTARAADHGDGPNVAGDQAADLGDLYLFLDPNDNAKVVMVMTFRGFIVPGEAVNFTSFDPNVLYRFQIEHTGDAKPDAFIDVTFDAAHLHDRRGKPPRSRGRANDKPLRLPRRPQIFRVRPPTPPSRPIPRPASASMPANQTIPFSSTFPPSAGSGIGSAGTPDPSVFSRGRDTFAGYNIMTIALSVPRDLIRGDIANNKIGVSAVSLRRSQSVGKRGVIKRSGKYRQLDREGLPAVNVALIPFARKDEYNNATTIDDSKNVFANDIVATLQSLGTDADHISTLAGLAVTTGDYLRLDLSVANTGTGGGSNTEAAFPNGRRLQDDVIDTILTIIANGTTLGDNVNANDKPFRDVFPFLARRINRVILVWWTTIRAISVCQTEHRR